MDNSDNFFYRRDGGKIKERETEKPIGQMKMIVVAPIKRFNRVSLCVANMHLWIDDDN